MKHLMVDPMSNLLSLGKRVSPTKVVTSSLVSQPDLSRNMNPLSIIIKWKGGGLNGMKSTVRLGIEMNLC